MPNNFRWTIFQPRWVMSIFDVVGHVHISWHPGGTEQGARFAHAGGGLMGALYRLWAGVQKIFD
jgi:hypothetical protein